MKDITKITEIIEYLNEISTLKNSLIMIALKDNAGFWLGEDIQNALNSLGIKETLMKAGMVGYLAILRDGDLLYEARSNENEIETYEGNLDGNHISMVSKPFSNGNESSIKINGSEYSVNHRGLNIVVLDYTTNTIVDRVSFDTHVKECFCTHFHDVAVVGVWFGANYGSLLNGYATYLVLKQNGKSVLMVNKPGADENDGEIHNTHNANFVSRTYPKCDISDYYSYDQITLLNNACDTFIVGSDQIWHYNQLKYFKNTMLLNFVSDNKKKISFATSFGHEKNSIPLSDRSEVQRLLERFDYISVREKAAERICKRDFDVSAQTVIDPVFCIDKNEYVKLADCSELQIESDYLLAYILDPSDSKNECLRQIEKSLNKTLYVIPDGFPWKYEENKKRIPFDNLLTGISAEDFVKLFMNADFIISDSYHGTLFSIIFNKRFISIANKMRGCVRFEDVLGRLGLLDRLIYDVNTLDNNALSKYLSPINYSEVNDVIEKEKNETLKWLERALSSPRVIHKPSIDKKIHISNCYGCGACYNACPVDAVEIKQDEDGFLRAFINDEKCIKCGRCVSVCPVLHHKFVNSDKPRCEALIADDELRKKSSSGGAFSLFANYIISHGGLVYGASFDDDFNVFHTSVCYENDLHKLRGSKYIQSDIRDCFRRIKNDLEANRMVLFTGTPCQVAGLYSFLNRDYDSLYTIDLLCHGISSDKVFEKYRMDVLGNTHSLTKLEFKAKKPWGWHAGINASFDDGSFYSEPHEKDPFFISYLNSISKNSTCASCLFNRLPRQGDLTIGDFWGIGKFDSDYDDGLGTSSVLINNKNGEELYANVFMSAKKHRSVPLEVAVKGNNIIEHPYSANNYRELFFTYLDTVEFAKLVSGVKNHCIYNAYYAEKSLIVPEEEFSLFELAAYVAKHFNGRQIVTWISSDKFEHVLDKYFGLHVSFGVSMRNEAVNGDSIRHFNELDGRNSECYIVSLDRKYDKESYDKLISFGYSEYKDFVYYSPKPVILKDYDLSGKPYFDENGNTIEGFDGKVKYIELFGRNNHITIGNRLLHPENISIRMHGNSNLTIGTDFNPVHEVSFELLKSSSGGNSVRIGNHVRMYSGLVRLYSTLPYPKVFIDEYTTFESNFELHANLGKQINIGKDCMFSHDVDIWAGDGHSIFDVITGLKTNVAKKDQNMINDAINIGNHVWCGKRSFILHGTKIGDGSIVGAMSVVKGVYPNNCVIAGNPAKMVKKDVAWARDMNTESPSLCGWENYSLTELDSCDREKVLILGGTGRMSRYLAKICIDKGADVTIATRGKHLIDKELYGVKKLIIDRENQSSVYNHLKGKKYDVIYDCSGYTPQAVDYVLSVIECNKYIYVSSFDTYARYHSGRNLTEEDLNISDNTYDSFVDRNDYAKAKYNSEILISNKYSGINYAIVRIPFVMSVEDDFNDIASSRVGKYVESVIKQKHITTLNLDNRYNFTDARDEAEFLYYLAHSDYKGVINFASEGDVSMREVINFVEKATGIKAIYSDDAEELPFTNHREVTMNLDKCYSLGYHPLNLHNWLFSENGKIQRYISYYLDGDHS